MNELVCLINGWHALGSNLEGYYFHGKRRAVRFTDTGETLYEFGAFSKE